MRIQLARPENGFLGPDLHQWWWEIRYDPQDIVVSANEIHIPVGRPVALTLTSRDVIHSFWVPALHGKRDLIPDVRNEIRVRADREGSFEGQCAEYCGYQHAHMRILLIAEPADRFEEWLGAQRQPAIERRDDAESRGRGVFMRATCILCHAISVPRRSAATVQIAPMSAAGNFLPRGRFPTLWKA